MRIPIDKIKHLLDKYGNEISLRYLKEIPLQVRTFKADEYINLDDIPHLARAGHKELEIVYTETLYDYLKMEYPSEFRKPYGWIDFISIDRHLEVLEKINVLSKRKRFLSIVGDVYGVDHRTGGRIVVLNHDETLDYRKWNDLKRYIHRDQKFFYRNSENAIILLVNLKSDADGNFIDRFKKNTELITAIVSRKKGSIIGIAPDFLPTEDVVSVTDPDKLLGEYIKSNARLIIIGETLTEGYKKSLLQVRQYDKYVRMMVVPFIDPKSVEHFLMQVKLVYNSDRWSE